jgi:putative intracellular protease/amidase
VPNVAMAQASPGDYAALIIPGGNVAKLTDNAAFTTFLREAAHKGVRIAAASQAASLAPDALVARTTDDVPQWTRNLLKELEL